MDSTLRELLNQNIQKDLSQEVIPFDTYLEMIRREPWIARDTFQILHDMMLSCFLRKHQWWGRLSCSGSRRPRKTSSRRSTTPAAALRRPSASGFCSGLRERRSRVQWTVLSRRSRSTPSARRARVTRCCCRRWMSVSRRRRFLRRTEFTICKLRSLKNPFK